MIITCIGLVLFVEHKSMHIGMLSGPADFPGACSNFESHLYMSDMLHGILRRIDKWYIAISRLTIVRREAKKKQAVRDK